MDTQLWNLFRETGDPLGYLLYKAESGGAAEKKTRAKPQETEAEDGSGEALSF